tara:strand:- start:3267 stop:4784 length:1518 start_codon:yes stop_codon:yes gene_type:complete
MADILGLNSAGTANYIAETNRNILARNALNLDRYRKQKQDLIDNVNGAKEVLATDQEEDRGKEGAETLTMANDLKHVSDLGVRDLLSRSETGQKVLGAVDSAGEKLNQVKSLSNSLIPQGDRLPPGELPKLDFFNASPNEVAGARVGFVSSGTGRDVPDLPFFAEGGPTRMPGPDNVNSVIDYGKRSFGVEGDPVSGISQQLFSGVDRGITSDTFRLLGGTSQAEKAKFFAGRARGRLAFLESDDLPQQASKQLINPIQSATGLKPVNTPTPEPVSRPSPSTETPEESINSGSVEPSTNSVEPESAREALKAGGDDAPVFASGRAAEGALPEGTSADVLGAGSKALNVETKVPGTIARGLQGLNVLGGAVDAGEDIAKGGIAGDNTASKVSNVAGTISGGLEGAGLAMEAAGAGLDSTVLGAPVGLVLNGLGAAAGAVGLVSGVIGDLKDEGKDKANLASAIAAQAKGPPKPQLQQTIAQQSYSLAGSYAGKADNNNKIQGTGAF